jgi:hypothetical protein
VGVPLSVPPPPPPPPLLLLLHAGIRINEKSNMPSIRKPNNFFRRLPPEPKPAPNNVIPAIGISSA